MQSPGLQKLRREGGEAGAAPRVSAATLQQNLCHERVLHNVAYDTTRYLNTLFCTTLVALFAWQMGNCIRRLADPTDTAAATSVTAPPTEAKQTKQQLAASSGDGELAAVDHAPALGLTQALTLVHGKPYSSTSSTASWRAVKRRASSAKRAMRREARSREARLSDLSPTGGDLAMAEPSESQTRHTLSRACEARRSDEPLP